MNDIVSQAAKDAHDYETGGTVSKIIPNDINSIMKQSNVISTDYSSNEYQKELQEAVDKYNQVDGIASEIEVFGGSFRQIGCGTASLMEIYAMLSGDFDF